MQDKATTPALRTAAIYAVVAALWIAFSDWLLARIVSSNRQLEQWSTPKGVGFVLVTALLLFLQLRRQLRRTLAEADARATIELQAIKCAHGNLFLAHLIEKSGQPIAIGYPDGRVGEVNVAFCELTGYTVAELKHMDFRDGLTPVEWREADKQIMAELERKGTPVRCEKEFVRKDGRRIPVEIFAHKSQDLSGQPCVLAFASDISKRKAAEKQLRLFAELGQRLNSTRTAREAGEVMVDVADKLFGWDSCKLTLYSKDEKVVTQLLTYDTVDGRRVEFPPNGTRTQPTALALDVIQHGAKLILKDASQSAPGTQPFGDGTRRSASLMFAPVRHGNNLAGIVTIQSYSPLAYDETSLAVFQSLADYCGSAIERIRAEEAVSRNEVLYRTLFELCPDGILLEDDQGRILDANQAQCLQTGYTREELRSLNVRQLTSPASAGEVDANLAALLSGRTLDHRILNRRKDGTDYLAELHERKIELPHNTSGVLVVCKDVTQRQQIEEQLRKLSVAVEQSSVSVVITDSAGNIEYVNPSFTRVTGYSRSEVLGKNPRVLKSGDTPSEDYRALWETITSGREWRGEFHNRRKSGELFWEYASISPIVNEAGRITHFLAIKEDITARKQMEDNLRQAQKMESIGRLAGGVAHDFNNILTIIQLQAGLMEAQANGDENIRESCLGILQAAERGSNLTRQLLVFSRRQAIHLRCLDLNTVIESTCKMLRRIVGEDIRINVQSSGVPLTVRADEGMLNQVLMNLTVNARDAMRQGGQLTIETSKVFVNTPQAALTPGARPGEFACLTVSDTGTGIAPELHSKIFEPFFTTKDVGQGTGLGLATVFSIVQQHQGWITLQSEPGKGATFIIHLPLAANTSAADKTDAPDLEQLCGGTETILVVEDEKAVAAMVRSTLLLYGYRVLEAANGASALDVWQQHKPEIDLILTDLVIPGEYTGRELAQRFAADRPGLKTIYMSGYSPEIAAKNLELQDGINFLPKPFPAHKLIQTIRARLDGVANPS